MSQKVHVPLDWRRIHPGEPFALGLQFFGEDPPADPPADPPPSNDPPADPPADPPKALTADEVQRLIDAKITPLAAEKKKLADQLATTAAELEKIRREKLTVEEQKALEAAEREKAISEEAAKNQRDKLEIASLRKLTASGYSQDWTDLILSAPPKDLDEVEARAKQIQAMVDKEATRLVSERLKGGGNPPKNQEGQPPDLSALSDSEFFERMNKKEK
jgi:hypothetical protein